MMADEGVRRVPSANVPDLSTTIHLPLTCEEDVIKVENDLKDVLIRNSLVCSEF
jgi:hypothetical protein